MKANPLFEKHRRQTMISSLFEHERSLIREACAQAIAQSSDQPIGAIQARFKEEEDRAIAWCAWLLNQVEREFGGGLDHGPIDEPHGSCAPRSRRLWMSKLGDDVGMMRGDLLWEMLAAFVAGFIVAQLTGTTGEMQRERDAFERELRKRLRLADEEAAKEEVAGTRRRASKTPAKSA